jgi:hypothetical protein
MGALVHQGTSQQRLRHGQVPFFCGGVVQRGVAALRLGVFVGTRSQQHLHHGQVAVLAGDGERG